MSPRFRIGIDLGTTNCALASIAAGDPEGRSVVLEIPQPETGHSTASALTLPSCLYLPPGGGAWIAGRWARARAAEVPGRVVRSAKSWLTHHAADRRAPFLPLGSTDLAPAELLSPVQAQARLLRVLADAWDAAHPDAPLAHQEVAVTVPASFDPVAQQLTLEAAAAAGFPAWHAAVGGTAGCLLRLAGIPGPPRDPGPSGPPGSGLGPGRARAGGRSRWRHH
jgi:molecular chaperone DnaK (HSP70)